MKLDLSRPIPLPNGQVIQHTDMPGGAPRDFTLLDALLIVLAGELPGDRTGYLEPDEKAKADRQALSARLFSGGEVEVSEDEVRMLFARAHTAFASRSPTMVFAVREALEKSAKKANPDFSMIEVSSE